MYYWREGGRRSQHPEPSNSPAQAVPSTMEYTAEWNKHGRTLKNV